jgi:hypothetical protein
MFWRPWLRSFLCEVAMWSSYQRSHRDILHGRFNFYSAEYMSFYASLMLANWEMGGEAEQSTVLKTLKECKERRGNLVHLCNLFCASTVSWEIRGWEQPKMDDRCTVLHKTVSLTFCRSLIFSSILMGELYLIYGISPPIFLSSTQLT